MRNLKIVSVLLFILSLYLIGCIQNQDSEILEHNSSQNRQTPKVFFYYIPKCPSCEKIKPYMNLMREEVEDVDFDFCDVSKFSECSNESQEIVDENELLGTPTVFLIYNNTITSFVGWREVSKLGYRLNELGIDTPDVIFNESHDLQCIVCHEQRNLPPPSTYTCTYCCH